MTKSQTPKLPAFKDIPVYQELYCSQELTNRLCNQVWKNQSDSIDLLAEQELLPFPNSRNEDFVKAMDNIQYYLWESAESGHVSEIPALGMIDLLYEIDRRIRNVLGLADIPVVGRPLSISPNGPYPLLIEVPFPKADNTESVFEKFQLINKYSAIAYQTNPKLIYTYCEQARRFLKGGEVYYQFLNLFEEVVDTKKISSSEVRLSMTERLMEMCKFPSVAEIKLISNKGLSL